MKDRIKAPALTTEVCIECLLVTLFMGMMFYSLSTLL